MTVVNTDFHHFQAVMAQDQGDLAEGCVGVAVCQLLGEGLIFERMRKHAK